MPQLPSPLGAGERALFLERGLCGWLEMRSAQPTTVTVHADPPATAFSDGTVPLALAPVETAPITLLLSCMLAGCLGVRP
jgi:hypothetical protein